MFRQDFYLPHDIKYLGLKMLDVPQINISKHFNEAVEFIEKSLKAGGVVLVHCLMGMSRSATLVLAFLMMKKGISVIPALELVSNMM